MITILKSRPSLIITAPALGAVVPVIKRFKPELIFQSETSPEVEVAWESIQGGKSSQILGLRWY